MKRFSVLLFLSFINTIGANAQVDPQKFYEAMPQILKGEYRGTFVNDSLVADILNEYLYEAYNRGLDLSAQVDEINLIAFEKVTDKSVLTGTNLAKIDKEKHLILLSSSCLLDRYILEVTLYREISHYLGVPYNNGGPIMSLERPKGYSYSWFGNPTIKQIECDELFAELKKIYKN